MKIKISDAIEIRKARLADAEVLATLCITVWIDTYCYAGIEKPFASYVLDEFSVEQMRQRILSKTVFVVEFKSNIIGVAVLDEKKAELETIYALPRFKAQGAGKLLMSTLQDNVQGRFSLNCWDENHTALSFYKAMGFVETGETFFELDGKKIRNVILTSPSDA